MIFSAKVVQVLNKSRLMVW